MKILKIILEIEDQETVEAYQDVDKSLILDDLQNGTLAKMCNIVKFKKAQKLICPFCGSRNVEMFTADDDWCTDCKKSFPGT